MWEIDKNCIILWGYNVTVTQYFVNEHPTETFYLYDRNDVWMLKNGRCRHISTVRFEKALIKALKLARGRGSIKPWGSWTIVVANGYLTGVCDEYLGEMHRLGLYKNGDMVVPKKLNKKQIQFAIMNHAHILDRLEILEGWLKNEPIH